MSSFNQVVLLGNLGKDAELKLLGEDNAVLNFSVATSEKFKNKAGEEKETTQWHRCALWGKRAKSLAKYLTKGTKVLVTGSVEYRKVEKDGAATYFTDIKVTDVRFAGGGKKSEGSSDDSGDSGGDDLGADLGGGSDDDIPF